MAARVGRGGETRRLTGPHKVAILLRLLEPEVATEIVRNLPDRDIARIHRADTDLGEVEEETFRKVATDFRSRLSGGKFSLRGRRVESLIRDSFDSDRMAGIFGQKDTDLRKISETLAHIDARVIGRVLSREYPQTAALVLSQLPPDQAKEVVLALPDELRVDVLMRIARMEKISEEMLGELNRALERELAGFENQGHAQEMGGLQVVVQLFQQMDRTTEEGLLTAISERDSDVADMIREQMFVFDDLQGVDDRGIQQLLRNVDNQTLVLALKGADEPLREKFLSNVSSRVAQSLREDLEAMGPVRLSEVEGAQGKIANSAREMIDRGEILVAGRGDDELV
jgi:flagellar motor switch protein FliG